MIVPFRLLAQQLSWRPLHGAMRRGAIIAAIRASTAGGTPLDARIAGRVVAGLPKRRVRAVAGSLPQFTDREAEVLELIAAGRKNAVFSNDLFLEASTMKSHVNAIFAKLGVTDRRGETGAVREALEGDGR